MTAVVSESLRILVRALQVDALPAGDVVLVERWTELPGFTVDRFRKLVLETVQRGARVSSVRYWEGAVLDAFRPLPSPEALPKRPRLLSERPWPDYLNLRTAQYGPPDAQTVADLWFRYNAERQVLGLPIEEEYEKRDPLSPVSGGGPLADTQAATAGG